uniref:Ecto-NOX disulfide-thiol exchanger 1 n=1 Tax=Cyprinodon variegatus TaxID=28743 RepID=A0A3Q2CLW4_CYPVA
MSSSNLSSTIPKVKTDHGAWATAMNNLGIMTVGISGQQLVSGTNCGFSHPAPLLPLCLPALSPPLSPPGGLIRSSAVLLQSFTVRLQVARSRPLQAAAVLLSSIPELAALSYCLCCCGSLHLRVVYLAGYRMRIGSSTDKKDSGRIHVDFAQARDDLYEWECKQRLLAREERHRRKIHEDRLRPPSPPPIVHYSEHEAGLLAEKLKDDNKFSEATAVLFTWIDRGEVNRRTANHFYSMIQSANSHVRRLMSEKALHEEEFERAKEIFKNALMGILTQFEQITGIFTAATRQKAWDHFSKAQRKNIDIWRKQCEELRNAHSEEIMGIRREEEMEMSDDDSDDIPNKRMRTEENGVGDQTLASLKEENDSLRWQLDAYRNEVELLKKEQSRISRLDDDHAHPQALTHANSPEAQIQLLQQSMHSMQQQLLSLQEKLSSKETELEQAREEHRYLEMEVLSLRDRVSAHGHILWIIKITHESMNGCIPSPYLSRDRRSEFMRGGVASEKEALLLGIISTFLHVHPFGANLEYLWSYIQRLDSKVSASELERLMVRLPTMFRQELSGVGATLEKRWKFCGFDSLSSA